MFISTSTRCTYLYIPAFKICKTKLKKDLDERQIQEFEKPYFQNVLVWCMTLYALLFCLLTWVLGQSVSQVMAPILIHVYPWPLHIGEATIVTSESALQKGINNSLTYVTFAWVISPVPCHINLLLWLGYSKYAANLVLYLSLDFTVNGQTRLKPVTHQTLGKSEVSVALDRSESQKNKCWILKMYMRCWVKWGQANSWTVGVKQIFFILLLN